METRQHGGDLLAPYSEALFAYLTDGQDSDLRRARELGHAALGRGVGVSEICSVHQESVQRILGDLMPCPGAAADGVAALTAAGTFLSESISPFEENRRELRRSNTALRYLNSRLENELQRFTHSVYAEPMQLLAAARLAMAGSSFSDPETGTVPGLLDQIDEQLAACTGDLMPRVLEDLGLECAIASLSRRFTETVKLDVRVDSAIGTVPHTVGVVLYRAVLEALTNVQRHAHANCVGIRLCAERSVIRCSIRDDGVGFDARSCCWCEERPSGLALIAESIRSLGGTLTIDSTPGAGTEIRISISRANQG